MGCYKMRQEQKIKILESYKQKDGKLDLSKDYVGRLIKCQLSLEKAIQALEYDKVYERSLMNDLILIYNRIDRRIRRNVLLD